MPAPRPRQFDLFDDESADEPGPRRAVRRRPSVALVPHDPETMAQALEASGDYRILRRLRPRPVIDRAASAAPRLGLIVDVETTGLSHDHDEVIEFGAVAFTYHDDGRFGDVVGVFNGLNQPSRPIPPDIVRLTGIDDAMVAGKVLDLEAVEALAAPADLVIAHNARFDRPFCEALAPTFATKPWACSVAGVPWRDYGFEGAKLGYLVGQAGLFHEGHRATDDCAALLEVLLQPVTRMDRTGPETPFAVVLAGSRDITVRLWAVNSPFEMKDKLKARGYRWSDGSDGQPRSWWIERPEADVADELNFLRQDIYPWPDAEPLQRRFGARDRFRRG